ncbi:hypothetical protein B0T13DRAFT_533799 [Neurospora crassa]|nr:hypothetical protein B0T13DRAFT_533799 [Neurospora crassa]
MDPTARFTASADSPQAKVDLLPDNINPESSSARSGRSINTQPADISESQDAGEEAQHDNNEAVTPTSQAASSTVDNTDFSLALNSNRVASSHTEVNGDESIQQDGQINLNLQIPDVPPPPPPPTEETLRQQAVAWMEAAYHNAPNGTAIAPPTWYTPSHASPSRPRVWMKDFFSGHVRPRRLVNDRLAEMSLMERERWVNRQRRIRGEPAE